MIKRNYKIDNIRALAMIMIVLAHCGAPFFVNNLRSFDVITLVFLSSYVINIDENLNKNLFLSKARKRFKRLMLPTVIFIVVMISFQFCVYNIMGRGDLVSFRTVLNSVLLCENGIGYVWIIKVYFINFLLYPVFVWISKKTKNIPMHLIIVGSVFICYNLMLVVYNKYLNHTYFNWIIINEWLLCCMFYSIIGLDAIYCKVNKFWLNKSVYIWGFVFIVSCFLYDGKFSFTPSLDKRPGGILYLSYGMMITYVLFKIIPDKKINLLKWISINSMDIYYIHTFFVFALDGLKYIFKIDNSYFFVIEFIIAFVGACLFTKVIDTIRKRFLKKNSCLIGKR